MSKYALALSLAAILLPGCSALANSGVKSQRLVLEAPTVHCLGARWYISGDGNGNASVKVEYRQAGEPAWRPGLWEPQGA